MIIGQPGSGKSTLARMLQAKTGLPVVYIDHIHWLPGWVERDRTAKTELCLAAEAQPQWIIEGGHSVTWGNRARRADVIIWMDVPVGRRLARVLWRTLRWWGQGRPDMPPGCVEGFHAQTLPFWAYIWRTRHSGRRNIEKLIASQPEKQIIRLHSVADVRRLIERWPNLTAIYRPPK